MAAKDDAGGVSAPEAAVAGDLHAAPREAGIGDASAAGVAGASASASHPKVAAFPLVKRANLSDLPAA